MTTIELETLPALRDGSAAAPGVVSPVAMERIDETLGMLRGRPASPQTVPARPLERRRHAISNVNVLRELCNSASVSVLIEGSSRGLVAKAWGTAIFSEFQDQDAAYLEAYDRASEILKELLQPKVSTEAPEDSSSQSFATCPETILRPTTNAELPMMRSASLDYGNSHLHVSGMRRSSPCRSQKGAIGAECETKSTTTTSPQIPHVTETSHEASCYKTYTLSNHIKQPHSKSIRTLLGLMRQLKTTSDRASSISNDEAARHEDSWQNAKLGAPVTRRCHFERYTAS